jgi:hypothetical protein
VADDLGADLDQLLPQTRQGPRLRCYFPSSRGSATRERGRLFLAGVGSGTVLFATSALFDAEPDLRLRVGVASSS